jgi:hypothetical protein
VYKIHCSWHLIWKTFYAEKLFIRNPKHISDFTVIVCVLVCSDIKIYKNGVSRIITENRKINGALCSSIISRWIWSFHLQKLFQFGDTYGSAHRLLFILPHNTAQCRVQTRSVGFVLLVTLWHWKRFIFLRKWTNLTKWRFFTIYTFNQSPARLNKSDRSTRVPCVTVHIHHFDWLLGLPQGNFMS